jgi:hypothetical protein
MGIEIILTAIAYISNVIPSEYSNKKINFVWIGCCFLFERVLIFVTSFCKDKFTFCIMNFMAMFCNFYDSKTP